MKTLIRSLLLLLLLCLCITPAEAQRRPVRPTTTIPYRNLNGKLIVDVEIGGKVRPFLFDTGASRTCITDALCEELSPDTVRHLRSYDSGGQLRTLPVVRLDTLKIGEWRIPNNLAVVAEGDNIFFNCYAVAGIIGSDILQKEAVRISSRDSTLTLTGDPSTWELDRRNSIKIKLQGTRPFFKLPVSRGSRKASHWTLIDTGAQGYSCRREGHFEHLIKQGVIDSLQQAFGRASYGLYGEEPVSAQWAAIAPEIHLGNTVLEHVPMTSTQGGSSLLGTFLLKYGDLTIDYKNKRFYYEPFEEKIWVEGTLPRQLSVMYVDNEFIVGVVWNEELGQQIAPGDKIITIGNRPSGEFSPCDLLTGVRKIGPKTLLQVENEAGEIIEVKL